MGVGRCPVPPRATKQRLPQSPDKAQGGCAERAAGPAVGRGVRRPLPLCLQTCEGRNTGEAGGKMAADAGHRPWGQREPGR